MPESPNRLISSSLTAFAIPALVVLVILPFVVSTPIFLIATALVIVTAGVLLRHAPVDHAVHAQTAATSPVEVTGTPPAFDQHAVRRVALLMDQGDAARPSAPVLVRLECDEQGWFECRVERDGVRWSASTAPDAAPAGHVWEDLTSRMTLPRRCRDIAVDAGADGAGMTLTFEGDVQLDLDAAPNQRMTVILDCGGDQQVWMLSMAHLAQAA